MPGCSPPCRVTCHRWNWALAAEDRTTGLTALLRRVELAGHDPKQVWTDAVGRRSLDDARQITSVLHSRISDRVTLDPMGDTFREWTPSVEDPQWQTYLSTLARAAWEERVASVAAYRELVGHDDETEPLGQPPRPG